VVAEATAMGEHNWCVQTRPYIHNLLNSAEEKNQLRQKGPSLAIWGMPMNAVLRTMI
jgi:hypothetical protein